ncbi:MAG: Asp-tRNA(Asn)/Glu-tRNA(Gln) amidotransferase subunit GatC [Nitrosotalea sp.]
MVDRKEIEHLGDLVKIELHETEKYIAQVDQILNYFDSLDKVKYDSDVTLRKETSYEDLREDKHEPFLIDGIPLINKLKRDQNNFVRAPKMI